MNSFYYDHGFDNDCQRLSRFPRRRQCWSSEVLASRSVANCQKEELVIENLSKVGKIQTIVFLQFWKFERLFSPFFHKIKFSIWLH